MKTLLLAVALAAVATPAMAQNWNYGNSGNGQFDNCGPNDQTYGRNGSSNRYYGNRYSDRYPGSNYGYGGWLNSDRDYDWDHSAHNPWNSRSHSLTTHPRNIYGSDYNYHLGNQSGYRSTFPRSGVDNRWYSPGWY